MRKGPAAEAERDSSQHAVGGIAQVFFFLIIQAFIFIFVSRPVDLTRADQQKKLNAPGGTFYLILVLKNAPGTLQTPRRRYIGIVLRNVPGGVYSVFYGTPIKLTTDEKH